MEIAIVILFVIGYLFIALEHNIKVNKSATAMILGAVLWTIYMVCSGEPKESVNSELIRHLGDISAILFFLMGAMTIVELIDRHNGFEIVTKRITSTKKVTLLWVIGFITFFLSSILDNLTSTIVMVSLLRKLIPEREDRLFFAGIVVIAANSGGAWTPIGDVTTTMLWSGGQISAANIIKQLFLPSVVSLAIPLTVLSFILKGHFAPAKNNETNENSLTKTQQVAMLTIGVAALISVPIFKTYTHLPPFMGMILGLGILWGLTELLHIFNHNRDNEFNDRSIVHALAHIDMSSILFFLGILLAVASLEVSGILETAAGWLEHHIANQDVVIVFIGIISSIVDNVPLVAAVQGMYPIVEPFQMDAQIWELLAYCAGTGGSMLIIGSAAGVAAMGMERINFFWYVKKISWLALLGYFAGIAVYFAQLAIF
ncbi:MAG: sodium:proton antiporter NhaD [Prevotellaceae bacterium]|jgi:Na+/H+ antiporter NhaD/arsenite permease-like protein|nr:sodium:proton antiporter NhaD [Prevotellaceae bacterium]